MPVSSLLAVPSDPLAQAAAAFDHAMEHRTLLLAAPPAVRFNGVGYFIDPEQTISRWRLNHQQAHNDILPTLGVNMSADLADTNLTNLGSRTWFTSVNKWEHDAAMANLPPDANLQYPVW